jgi:hypothetical protein
MNTTDVEAALANCRALIDQINAGLSAEEPFVDASSATELQFYLKRAASALKKSLSRSRVKKVLVIARAWEDEDRPQLSLTVPRW